MIGGSCFVFLILYSLKTRKDGSILRCLIVVFVVVPPSGYWNVIVYGRKHSYRLYTKLLNEATRWANSIQNVIDSKAPIDTPTQQLIQDIKVHRGLL